MVLSPAFDVNPSIDKDGLTLNIDEENNLLDFELARSVGEYFQLNLKEMDVIIEEVKTAVSSWYEEAKKIGIPRGEIMLMESAFKV